jgi:SIR2-like domain
MQREVPKVADRRKLLIVAGAGASVDFGMPSVSDIDAVLAAGVNEHFRLLDDPSRNLYQHIRDTLTAYWKAHKQGARPNFEHVLQGLAAISSLHPSGRFTGALGAFAKPLDLPMTQLAVLLKGQTTANPIVSHLASSAVDTLLDNIRRRCTEPVKHIDDLRGFLEPLMMDYEVSVVTTNYDDLIYRCLRGIETGFQGDGHFDPGRLVKRRSWPCLLHLHGSVHFDMDISGGDMHSILWREDLGASFHQNSQGRTPHWSSDGRILPTSVLVTGGDKPEQMLRQRFRIYYSEMDRLIQQSDALLVCGFSFGDPHIRYAFADYWSRGNRPTVVVDFLADNQVVPDAWAPEHEIGAQRVLRMAHVQREHLEYPGYPLPIVARDLKATRGFQRCVRPGQRVSISYGGMLDACQHPENLLAELL